jgi:uncharacterized protein YlxW (UPF0749 family)
VLRVPIQIKVIGDATVLTPALEIPGGLVDTITSAGGTVKITESTNISIKSVVPLTTG